MVFADQSGFYLLPLVLRTYAPVLPNGPWIRSEYCVNPSQVGPQLRLLKELPATKPKSIVLLFGAPTSRPRAQAMRRDLRGIRSAGRDSANTSSRWLLHSLICLHRKFQIGEHPLGSKRSAYRRPSDHAQRLGVQGNQPQS